MSEFIDMKQYEKVKKSYLFIVMSRAVNLIQQDSVYATREVCDIAPHLGSEPIYFNAEDRKQLKEFVPVIAEFISKAEFREIQHDDLLVVKQFVSFFMQAENIEGYHWEGFLSMWIPNEQKPFYKKPVDAQRGTYAGGLSEQEKKDFNRKIFQIQIHGTIQTKPGKNKKNGLYTVSEFIADGLDIVITKDKTNDVFRLYQMTVNLKVIKIHGIVDFHRVY